jgi:hypothetical protein
MDRNETNKLWLEAQDHMDDLTNAMDDLFVLSYGIKYPEEARQEIAKVARLAMEKLEQIALLAEGKEQDV